MYDRYKRVVLRRIRKISSYYCETCLIQDVYVCRHIDWVNIVCYFARAFNKSGSRKVEQERFRLLWDLLKQFSVNTETAEHHLLLYMRASPKYSLNKENYVYPWIWTNF